ncbi:MAG: nodulation protein NfeD [Caldilineaceae bacterium]
MSGLLLSLAGNVLAAASSNMQLAAAAQVDGANQRIIYVLTFEGAVTPVLEKYIVDSIDAARAAQAQGATVEAIILQLDTPGGSVDVTKSITQEMLASRTPIVVYVAPTGSHAGSAGTFITLAGHAAAMAPGSSIGAASPVGSSGEDVGATMEAKVKNILSADIENLAARRGDAAKEWAVQAVQEAAAATSDRALELGVIDFVAADLPDLLAKLDGFAVTVDGQARTLETGDAVIERRELNPIQQFLNLIANPTVATILLTIGSAGLLAEVWNPGTWIPGAIGVVCLLLGMYALGQLDANFAGLGLMALALVLFVSEAFTPTFGALALGGAISFGLGAALLFDAPGVAIPWPAIITLTVALSAFSFFAGSKGLAAQRRPAKTGSEGLIGQIGAVKTPFGEHQRGSVFVYGEWWNARLEKGAVNTGDEVEVIGRQGYTLLVRPVER